LLVDDISLIKFQFFRCKIKKKYTLQKKEVDCH